MVSRAPVRLVGRGVDCWTHWLWTWRTVGRVPAVKAGQQYCSDGDHVIRICRCSDIKHLILHYSYLHTYISMLILCAFMCTFIWFSARSACGFTTLLQVDATRAGEILELELLELQGFQVLIGNALLDTNLLMLIYHWQDIALYIYIYVYTCIYIYR